MTMITVPDVRCSAEYGVEGLEGVEEKCLFVTMAQNILSLFVLRGVREKKLPLLPHDDHTITTSTSSRSFFAIRILLPLHHHAFYASSLSRELISSSRC